MKFALLSHILPPSPSGQAVVLFRILSGFAPEEYYLISREKYEPQEGAKFFLPSTYYTLRPLKYLFLLNKFKPGFIRDILTIVLSVFSRTHELVKILRANPANILVACSGDIADIPAGFLASSILGIPFVAYIFDDYVYQWTGSYRSFAQAVAPYIFKHCRGVIGPNEFLCDEYKRRYGVECALVHNAGDQEEFEKPVYSCWPFEAGKITMMYTGSVYHANYDCFQNLIRAINALQDYPIELHIFTSQTPEQLNEQGIHGQGVHIHSHRSYAEILEYQRKADILFLPLAFETPIKEVIHTSAPGKLAEYLASGRPVLAHVPPDSFVAYYLEKNQCGLVASENDPDDLKARLLLLINNESLRRTIVQNGHQRVQTDFHPQVARKRFSDFLSESIDRNLK